MQGTRLIVGVLAAATTVFSIYAAYATEEVLLDAVKDLVIFFATLYFSYQIAINDANKVTEKQIQALGKATIRRIKILYNDIQTLAERVTAYDCSEAILIERNANTVDTLLRLQNAVKASFDEIKQTANLPLEDSDLYDLPQFATLSRQNSATLKSLGNDGLLASFSDQVSCPRCKTICKVVVAHHAGATGHVDCDSCRANFLVHRRQDGNLFVGKSNNLEIKELECPNQRCKSEIRFKYKGSDETVHRSCPDCYQKIDFYPKTNATTATEIKHFKISRDASNASPVSYSCEGCNIAITGTPFINKKGERVMFCFGCGTVTLVTLT